MELIDTGEVLFLMKRKDFMFEMIYPERFTGFVLFVCSWFSLALYLIWALLPTPYLDLLHLTYLPAKYWAIAIPLLLPITVAAFVILVLAYNLIQLHGVFEDIEVSLVCSFENETGCFLESFEFDLFQVAYILFVFFADYRRRFWRKCRNSQY